MAQLLVNDLEDDLVRELVLRADGHGVSPEEEHRKILEEALSAGTLRERTSFWQTLGELPDVGEDALFERERGLRGRKTEHDTAAD